MASVTISELQRNAKQVVDDCVASGHSVGITRYGETPVTMVPTDFYLELLRRDLDRYDHEMQIQRDIMRGYEDFLAGRVIPLEEVIAEMDAKWGIEND